MKQRFARGSSAPEIQPHIHWSRFWPMCVLLILALIPVTGCSGCLQSDEKLTREELEKRAKEQKSELQYTQLLSLPIDTETKILTAKPGHWVETQRDVKSNREDLQVIAKGDVLRGADRLLNIPGTNITAEFSRPTVLPKGQTKKIDLQYFVPTSASVVIDATKGESNVLRLRSSLLSRNLLTPLIEEPFAANELKHHEFIFVIACPKPLEYRFFAASDLVLWKSESLMASERVRSYQVVLCESGDKSVDLPTSLMTMTSMAVLLWDDVTPEALSSDQQEALVDWIHWGGQLIISGPNSWSRLQNSFLSPYLPTRSSEVTELTTEDFAAMSETWTAQDAAGIPPEPLKFESPKIPGLKMTPVEGAQALPGSGDLVLERYVGRGRIVMTGFPLREPRINKWKNFSNFVSTGLLRRPPRNVRRSAENFINQVFDAPYETMEYDPRLNSFLRITSRDLPISKSSNDDNPELKAQQLREIQERMKGPTRFQDIDEKQRAPLEFGGNASEAVQWSPNGAAWSDSSGLAFRSLESLRKAAGIVLPDRWTLITLLSGYLVILVPLNWLVFKLMRRLEYAWIAAPIIALIGVVVVTRVARLDIGFARRATQIGLLELQGEYQRGHVTNYLALYTSLSTNYGMEFPERGSVALPVGDPTRRVLRAGLGTPKVVANYGSSAGMRLEPVTVYSNSTAMLHAEQMVDVGGGLLFQAPQDGKPAAVKNTGKLNLQGALAVRKTSEDRFEIAWVGDLLKDESKTIEFRPANFDDVWKHWNTNPITHRQNRTRPNQKNTMDNSEQVSSSADSEQSNSESASNDEPVLLVGGILEELLYAVPLVAGQTRLFAFTDDIPTKVDIEPANDQFESRLVVMAHLTPPIYTRVVPDKRIISRLPNQPTEDSSGESEDTQ